MVISFMVEEARNYLEENGFVYTLRPKERKKLGKDWYNHFRTDIKRGDINIEYLGDFTDKDDELLSWVAGSGFNDLKSWLEKAKNSRHLYRIEISNKKEQNLDNISLPTANGNSKGLKGVE